MPVIHPVCRSFCTPHLPCPQEAVGEFLLRKRENGGLPMVHFMEDDGQGNFTRIGGDEYSNGQIIGDSLSNLVQLDELENNVGEHDRNSGKGDELFPDEKMREEDVKTFSISEELLDQVCEPLCAPNPSNPISRHQYMQHSALHSGSFAHALRFFLRKAQKTFAFRACLSSRGPSFVSLSIALCGLCILTCLVHRIPFDMLFRTMQVKTDWIQAYGANGTNAGRNGEEEEFDIPFQFGNE